MHQEDSDQPSSLFFESQSALPGRFSRSSGGDEWLRRSDVTAAIPVSRASFPRQRKFKSARLNGDYEKPWIEEKNPRKKWENIIFWVCVLIGFAIGGSLCYMSYISVTNLEYCLLLEDNFETIDPKVWSYEIQRGGFGTGSFEWTTNDSTNAYVDASGLHIVPKLTTESTNITANQLIDGYVLNLATAGTCTSTDVVMCSVRSNKTAGSIINPVRSARLVTKGKKMITYGRVEVVAKMPRGSWLWPAIWMMPEASVYGPWPASGEIDIAESRGNSGSSYPDGRDSVTSALHWGPVPEADAFWRTSGKHNIRRTDYTENFHTYGLEWNRNYLFTYIDSRLLQVFFIKFNTGSKSMWNRGDFGEFILNRSALFDPWSQTGRPNTPFDQPFYLILNVAVGGTNGFFPDGVGNKPWGDNSNTAPKEFWDAHAQWYPTWGEGDTRGLTVRSVKMWNEGTCGRAGDGGSGVGLEDTGSGAEAEDTGFGAEIEDTGFGAEVEDTGFRTEAEDRGFGTEAEDTGFRAEAEDISFGAEGMQARETGPRERHVHEVHTYEMRAYEMHAHEIHAYEMHTYEIYAYEMHTYGRFTPMTPMRSTPMHAYGRSTPMGDARS